jgi:hypothetical protein
MTEKRKVSYVWKIIEESGAQRDTPRHWEVGARKTGARDFWMAGIRVIWRSSISIAYLHYVPSSGFLLLMSEYRMDLSLGGAGRGRGCSKPTFIVQQPTTMSARESYYLTRIGSLAWGRE